MKAERRTRIDLHNELCEVLGAEDRVYYAPPTRMKYPCIHYIDDGEDVDYGDNARYKVKRKWTIMVIDEDPDSEIPERLVNHFPYCSKDRVYAADNLYHFVYTLYY